MIVVVCLGIWYASLSNIGVLSRTLIGVHNTYEGESCYGRRFDSALVHHEWFECWRVLSIVRMQYSTLGLAEQLVLNQKVALSRHMHKHPEPNRNSCVGET